MWSGCIHDDCALLLEICDTLMSIFVWRCNLEKRIGCDEALMQFHMYIGIFATQKGYQLKRFESNIELNNTCCKDRIALTDSISILLFSRFDINLHRTKMQSATFTSTAFKAGVAMPRASRASLKVCATSRVDRSSKSDVIVSLVV